MKGSNILFVLLGPTAVGKTEISLQLAEHLKCPIISADSRQMYRDLPIGTAAPTAEEQSRAKHYFVGHLMLDDYYSASVYEKEALQIIERLFSEGYKSLVLSGGSMMYVDAICNGIDQMPDIQDDIRQQLKTEFRDRGLSPLVEELQRLDPCYAGECDLQNPVRVIHALEICRQTGKTYSSFRTNKRAIRPFNVVKIGLERPREELFERINKRVDVMVDQGFIEEARRVYPYRNLNSLNTVGYKEIFKYFDGIWPLDVALDRMRKNTRVYAKKQMTWYKRDTAIHWFHPSQINEIKLLVESVLL